MKVEDIKKLPDKLREIESRSKDDLLEQAAAAIEQLLKELEMARTEREVVYKAVIDYSDLKAENKALALALNRGGTDCELCKHNGKMECNEDCECETCSNRDKCVCHNCCEEHHNFVWKGEEN